MTMHRVALAEASYPRGFLMDIVKATWVSTPVRWTTSVVRAMDLCDYHVHEEGIRCNGSEAEERPSKKAKV